MIKVNTTNPSNLETLVDKAIKDGSIKTWEIQIHDDVKYYTHTPEQWRQKAYLRPYQANNMWQLYLVWPKVSNKEKAVSGVYHGRFIEMLCTHFANNFADIDSTIP